MPCSLRGRLLRVLVVLSVLLLGTQLPATPASAAGRAPTTPSGLPSGIETLAPYVPNNSCSPGTRPGTDKLAALLRSTYGRSVGTSRACNGSVTEHSDGRAVDLMLSARNSTQKADATALNSWLLATDRSGQKFANARRLGVMYIIWDGRIWSSYRTGDGWREYNGCASRTTSGYDTTCHRDHVHISLSWAGALGSTSFWTKQVAAQRYGACPASGNNWAASSTNARSTPCPTHTRLTASSTASAAYKALVPWAGYYMKTGSTTGTPVRAWQQALKVSQTGTWDSATVAATKRLQSRHGLSQSGTANSATWRVMLSEHRPR